VNLNEPTNLPDQLNSCMILCGAGAEFCELNVNSVSFAAIQNGREAFLNGMNCGKLVVHHWIGFGEGIETTVFRPCDSAQKAMAEEAPFSVITDFNLRPSRMFRLNLPSSGESFLR